MTDHATAARLPSWTVPVRVAVIFGVTLIALLLLTRAVGDRDPAQVSTLGLRIAGGAVLSLIIIAAILILTRMVEHRRFADVGVPSVQVGWRAFLVGFLMWLVPASVVFVVFALLGMPLTISASIGQLIIAVTLVLLAVLLSEAIPEELVFRGYLTAVLAERMRSGWVVAIQTALFTLTAFLLRGSFTLVDLSLFITMGAVLGYLRLVTGTVWLTVGFHTAFQTGSQVILTQPFVDFPSITYAYVALGMVPFTAAAILVPIINRTRPQLFGSRGTASPDSR